ncbi:ankyrin repeat domain-containing protein [Burkholderiaceae bacterium DAT-1]|nr:ankyrin repeat domain-containing protein [Burkholderiaceae bacterium DAT-1]
MNISLTEMYRYAEVGDIESLMAHIDRMRLADPDWDIDLNSMALIAAAESNQLHTVEALIDRGASLEGVSPRPWIRPLWKAAKRGHIEIVKVLVERGADILATDNRGQSAIDYARRYKRADVLEYLERKVVDGSNNSLQARRP